jgi:hypothetical protein
MKPVFGEDGHAAEAGTIRAYYFDHATGEYTGWSDEFINIGVSMPGCSTDIVPGDEVAGVAQVFTGQSWEAQEDHRGKTVYSTSDRKSSVVDYIGPVREGFTLVAPLTQFDKWIDGKWVTDASEQNESITVSNTQQKAALIFEASSYIAPLVDARDGGYIDEADVPVLAAWQKYRYALTKVDPAKPVWPARPES